MALLLKAINALFCGGWKQSPYFFLKKFRRNDSVCLFKNFVCDNDCIRVARSPLSKGIFDALFAIAASKTFTVTCAGTVGVKPFSRCGAQQCDAT